MESNRTSKVEGRELEAADVGRRRIRDLPYNQFKAQSKEIMLEPM